MGRANKSASEVSISKQQPALTPEARENQMIALAIRAAEKQLLDGTASSQVITHYLKLGTEKERLEREKLQKENELLRAKTEAIKSAQRDEELFNEVIRAMKIYTGNDDELEDESVGYEYDY